MAGKGDLDDLDLTLSAKEVMKTESPANPWQELACCLNDWYCAKILILADVEVMSPIDEMCPPMPPVICNEV